jgi:hypothetical protein
VIRRSLLCLVVAACSASKAGSEGDLRAAAAGESRCASPVVWAPWEKLGVVRGLPDAAAAGDGVLSPSLVDDGGVLHLWYSSKTGSRFVLMHSTSSDAGESFAEPVTVTGLDDRLGAYPFVWRQDGRFELLFGSGSLERATSDDGVAFTRAKAPVLSASFDANRFDALSVLYPSRVEDDGGAATLFFSGFDGHHVRVGRAVPGPDGSFSVDPPRPVVDLGAPGDFDNSAAAQPHVQRAFGQWWMWYGGYDTSHTNPGPYRIGSASSADGVAWDKHGVVVDLSATGTDAWSTRDPSLMLSGGRWLMFYVGLGEDGRYRLHRATSQGCSSAASEPRDPQGRTSSDP